MPPEPQDETLDPRAPRSTRLVLGEGAKPRIEILFHSDLRRVGDSLTVGEREVIIGRDGPSFSSARGAAPLNDPCVSRRQLSVAYRSGAFVVLADPSARRPLSFFGPGGEPRSPSTSVEPGSLVAIGDRILLRLAHAPDDGDDLGIVGRSAAAIELRRAIRSLADAASTVLVRGETGVGKELVARALHEASRRKGAPFVAVNCAALPENLVESELFGHARGAFSGATTAKAGLFRAAGAGTIFLDEIGELPLPMQAKLLRALQERAVRPLGESTEIPFDARVVCATNRDLAQEVEEGRFRADLFGRIEAPEILVPPLRARVVDAPLIFARFFEAQVRAAGGRVLPAMLRAADVEPPPIPLAHVLELLRYPWPRNVRELERHVGALAASSAEAGSFRLPGPFPPRESLRAPGTRTSVPPEGGERPRARPDLDELLRVLESNDHVQHQAARALGVSRTTLDRWLRELGVRRPKDVPDDEILAAYRAAGNVEAAAQALRISARGMRLRLTELGVDDA
ncbi:MAG: sigma 54-interacting transcriptional regulator [Deltaproteobacteria bacterium]|nr:sigma 54-interacting transcriptional regulator [Deltaproteobacteria bacterium]